MNFKAVHPFETLFRVPLKNGLTRPKRVRGYGIPMVNMGEIFAYSRIKDIEMERVPVSDAERDGFLLESGDLLFARQSLVLAGAGKCSLFLGNTEPTTFESHIIRCRLNSEEAYAPFYFYYFQSPQGRVQIQSIAEQGAGASGIRGSDLARLRVPKPEINVQKAIANFLSIIDEKIDHNLKINVTLEHMIQTLFKSWFIDFDPVKTKATGRNPEGINDETAALFPSEFEGHEQRLIPKGWRVGELREICNNYREGINPADVEPDTPYIGLEHMPRKSISLGAWASVSKVESGKSQFRVGDILFGKLRPYFHKVGVAPVDGVCSTDILVIRPTVKEYFGIALSHLSSIELINHADRLSNGAKMPRTKWEDLAAYNIVIPPINLAGQFSEFVLSATRKIRENILESRMLTDMRDMLLPKLISGQLPIPDIEQGGVG